MIQKSFYLIDDDPIFQFMVKKAINAVPEKIDLKIFNNGLEAIRSLRTIEDFEEFPDIIFLDLNMPVLDGWEFLEEYKHLGVSSEKDIYIYMISGSQDIKTLHKAMDYEVLSGYFSKPVSQGELTMIVEGRPKDYWDTIRQMESFGRLQTLRNHHLNIFQKSLKIF